MTFDLCRYLSRLNLTDSAIPATVEGLHYLLTAQMRALPYETIDGFLDASDRDAATAWQTIIQGGRGGQDEDLNGLFGKALSALGFAFLPVVARVGVDQIRNRSQAHLVTVVSIDGQCWLADTGFCAGAPFGLVNLASRSPQYIGGEVFRVTADSGPGDLVLERKRGHEWQALYGIDRIAMRDPGFAAAHVQCMRRATVPPVADLDVNIASARGRAFLHNRDVRSLDRGVETRWTIRSAPEMGCVLTDIFGLSLDAVTVDRIWQRLDRLPQSRAA